METFHLRDLFLIPTRGGARSGISLRQGRLFCPVVVVSIMLAFFITLPSHADSGDLVIAEDIKRSVAAIMRGSGLRDFIESVAIEHFEKWRDAADAGNPDGIWLLARCYRYGVVVEEDIDKTIKLLRRSAAQGHAMSQNYLGLLFKHYDGPEDRTEEALAQIRLAAVHGFAPAQNNLAVMYENGECGLKQNYHEAARLYRLAADQDNALAQSNLGMCLLNGKGVKQNIDEGIAMLNKAAQKKLPLALANLANIAHSHDISNLDREETARALYLASKEGFEEPYAHLVLSKLYYFDHMDEVARDILKQPFGSVPTRARRMAYIHGRLAGSGGYPFGYFIAGTCAFWEGDTVTGRELLLKAANQGDGEAMITMSVFADLEIGDDTGWLAMRRWYGAAKDAKISNPKETWDSRKAWVIEVLAEHEHRELVMESLTVWRRGELERLQEQEKRSRRAEDELPMRVHPDFHEEVFGK